MGWSDKDSSAGSPTVGCLGGSSAGADRRSSPGLADAMVEGNERGNERG